MKVKKYENRRSFYSSFVEERCIFSVKVTHSESLLFVGGSFSCQKMYKHFLGDITKCNLEVDYLDLNSPMFFRDYFKDVAYVV